MSTGDITFTNPYTARTATYSAGSQVLSADLNAQQDGVIDVGAAVDGLVDDINDNLGYVRSASGGLLGSPAPDVGGAHAVWMERITNGIVVVVIDNQFDWRDRYLHLVGVAGGADDVAGGANDDVISVDLSAGVSGDYFQAFLYTRNGQDGSGTAKAYDHTISAGNVIRFFARDSDGALCMCRTTAGSDFYLTGRVSSSPKQNHY